MLLLPFSGPLSNGDSCAAGKAVTLYAKRIRAKRLIEKTGPRRRKAVGVVWQAQFIGC